MKTELKIYKLHFETPLHLGDERDDYSISLQTFRSDAMYAAIMATIAKLGYKIPDNGDLGFTTSSLFPFYQKSKENKAVLFFPKHLIQYPIHPDLFNHVKKIKRIIWIDQDYFEKQINGRNIFNNDLSIRDIKKNFLTSKDIDEDFITSQISPRVTISRTGLEDARPFYMDRVFFKHHSGLYFIAYGENFDILDKAMDVLKDEGIGTDRNVGNGYFSYLTDNIQIDLPVKGNAMALSMFCPENREQLNEMLPHINSKDISTDVSYDFLKRGGWITTTGYNTYRKNSIYMFTEGSVFGKKIEQVTISGKIADLTPKIQQKQLDHKVFRNGRAIFIPVNTH